MANQIQSRSALPLSARLLAVALVAGAVGFAAMDLGGVAVAAPPEAPPSSQPAETDATTLALEVDALSALNDLQLSADQATKLRDLAKGAAGTAHAAPGASDPDHLAATRALRKALLSGSDNAIDSAEGKLADVEDQMDADPDPMVDLTAQAKSSAEAAMKLLSPRQLANYLGSIADGVPDISDIIMAIDDSHQLSQEDFVAERDRLAEDFVTLMGGIHPKMQPKIGMRIKNLLDRARKMPDDQFAAKAADLHAEAAQLTGDLDPVVGLRHCMEREMAELLSNPQLPHALDEWKPVPRNNSD